MGEGVEGGGCPHRVAKEARGKDVVEEELATLLMSFFLDEKRKKGNEKRHIHRIFFMTYIT